MPPTPALAPQRTLYGLVGLGSVSDYVTKNSQTNVVRGLMKGLAASGVAWPSGQLAGVVASGAGARWPALLRVMPSASMQPDAFLVQPALPPRCCPIQVVHKMQTKA